MPAGLSPILVYELIMEMYTGKLYSDVFLKQNIVITNTNEMFA